MKTFIVKMYTIDLYIDSNSYTDPLKKIIRTTSSFLSPKLYEQNMLTIRNAKIISDTGFILNDLVPKEGIEVSDLRRSYGVDTYNSYGKKMWASYLLISEHFENTVYRKYMKIQEVFASIGGMLKFVQFMTGIILEYYVKTSLYYNIFKLTYKREYKENGDLKSQMSSHIEIRTDNYMLKSINQNSNANKNEVSRLNREKTKKIKEARISLCKMLLAKCNRKTSKVRSKLMNHVSNKLDIVNIIKTQNDVKKLKCLLFDIEKLNLFDSTVHQKDLLCDFFDVETIADGDYNRAVKMVLQNEKDSEEVNDAELIESFNNFAQSNKLKIV
jgi:hypothetical protein